MPLMIPNSSISITIALPLFLITMAIRWLVIWLSD